MCSLELRELVVLLVEDNVGPDGRKVFEAILDRAYAGNGCPLSALASTTGLAAGRLQDVLLRLMCKGAVTAMRADVPAAAGKERYLYHAVPSAVLLWLRYPRFVSLAAAEFGPEGEAILLELAGAGALTQVDIVEKTLARPLIPSELVLATSSSSSSSSSSTPSSSLLLSSSSSSSMAALSGLSDREARVKFVLDCIIRKGFIVPLAPIDGRLSSGGSIAQQQAENAAIERLAAASATTTATTSKRRRTAAGQQASTLPDFEPFIPLGIKPSAAAALDDDTNNIDDDDDDSGNADKQQQQQYQAVSQLWTINPQRFMLLLRREQCVAMATQRFNETLGKIVGLLVDMACSSGSWSNNPESRAIFFSEVQKAWTASKLDSAQLAEGLGHLVRDSSKLVRSVSASNPHTQSTESAFFVRYEAIFQLAQHKEVESIIFHRYDQLALRLFRFINIHRLAEETQIAEECVAPPQEAKAALMTMYQHGLLNVITVPKSVDRHPLRCIFLWQADYDHAARLFTDQTARAIKNLIARSRHLDASHQLLLNKVDEFSKLQQTADDFGEPQQIPLSPAETHTLARYRAMNSQLKASICHLDYTIMLLNQCNSPWPVDQKI